MLTPKQQEQYDTLCEDYPEEHVELLLSLLGTEELFDGIPAMLEDGI